MDEGVRDCDNVMGMLLMSAVGWSYSAASYRVSRSDLALWLRVRRTAGNGDYASRRYHAGHTLISGVFTIACVRECLNNPGFVGYSGCLAGS